ncbi:MAG TPA: sensor histidine kinase [Puia sp.]|uniref:sensor histidine kinase n=1 Tax=Puia sp. TaxID=2045100 RepID=UPI002C0A2B62|nr:sensor histidine kinase [Puia sp.]HVU96158.1 sensor histidine kinase [Puia sp.]
MMRDGYDDRPVAAYIYIIFVFLAALFYGNVFWLFPKIIRNKKRIARVTICAAWFTILFGANYLLNRPLFEQANPAPIPVPLLISKANGQTAFRPVQPGDPLPRPRFEAITFMISDWRQMQPFILFAFLVIEGVALAWFFLKAWAKSELIQAQLQASQLSTEIKFLKSQINPHFLFNTLNNLFSMAQGKGNDELADGISKLSGMMRYMLYDSNEERVPLCKEIAYLEECITLNKLRYADEEVKVIFDHTGTAETRIAPMLFIPFVENAFKHGVAIGQRSAIRIAIAVSGQKLNFSCVNTDYSRIKKMDMQMSGIGLENVKRRLELAYPAKHLLTIDREEGKFIIKLEIDLS